MQNLLYLLPGEDITGFLGRLSELSPYGDLNAIKHYMGVVSAMDTPGELTQATELHIARKLGILGTNWLSQHSGSHALQYSLNRPQWQSWKTASCQGEHVGITLFKSGDIIFNPWRWCPDCVAQDIDAHGTAYYHRDHQIKGVMHCVKHDMVLVGECTHCGFYPRHLKALMQPPHDEKCPDCRHSFGRFRASNDPIVRQVNEVCLDMASGALQGDVETLTQQALDFMGLRQQDIDTKTGRQKVRRFYRELMAFYGQSGLENYFDYVMVRERDVFSPAMKRPRLFNSQSTMLPLHPVCHALTHVFVSQHERTLACAA